MEVERRRNESQKLKEKKGEGNLNIEFWQIYAKSSQVPRIIVIKAATVAENNIGAAKCEKILVLFSNSTIGILDFILLLPIKFLRFQFCDDKSCCFIILYNLFV